MVSGEDLPAVGTRAVIVLATTRLSGTVVWNQDGYCGLLLRTPIEPLQIVREMTRARPDWADSGRP